MKTSKRGQVTLFILVGVLVAAVFVLYFAFQGDITGTSDARRVAEDVPLEFNPLKVFTEDCLRITAEQGLIRLGQQGGYIRPREWHGLRFESENPTDSDGVLFSDTAIPYWLYNSAANDANIVQLSTLKPTTELMEAELKQWVEEELDYCIDAYRTFTSQGYAVQAEEPEARVSITERSINVQLIYPLTAQHETRRATFENFYTEVPLKLQHMIDVANSIFEAQRDFSFLEEHTLSVMTLFSGTETTKLPPMTDTTFELASAVVWQENDVKQMLQDVLSTYVGLLQFYGSRNFFSYQVESDEKFQVTKQRIYDNMILPLSGAEDLDVRFTYLDEWQPYFDANARGGVIKPQNLFLSTFGVVFGLQKFKTTYDVSYPVWITLYDPAALGNRGFFFNFALETNVRNNRPVEHDDILPSPVLAGRDSLLCDVNQRKSGIVTIVVQDENTQLPIPNAQVTFVLGDKNCAIGATDDAGVLSAPLPIAVGGVVHVNAPDYVGTSKQINPAKDKDEILEIAIAPLHELNLLIQKKKVFKCGKDGCMTTSLGGDPLAVETGEGWQFSTVPVNLKPNEQAVVTLKRVSRFDDPFTFSQIVTGAQPVPARLPSGTYTVSIQLMLNEEFVIPAQRKSVSADVFGIDVAEEEYTIPEVKFEPLVNGGLELDAEHALVITSDLYGANELRLFAVSPALTDIPKQKRRIEDLDQMSKVTEYSETYAEQLVPEYRVAR